MRYNTQRDVKWVSDSMGMSGDFIGRWGCLVTVLANIYQDKNDLIYTPGDLNTKIKLEGLYFGTDHPGKESFVKTDELLEKMDLKLTRDIPYMSYVEKINTWYYVRVLFEGYGHYINVIKKSNDKYLCFDVWDGKLKYYSPNQITAMYKVEI